MVQLNKHKILWQCYDLTQAIEEFPPSNMQTAVVVKASELLDELEKLVDKENKNVSR